MPNAFPEVKRDLRLRCGLCPGFVSGVCRSVHGARDLVNGLPVELLTLIFGRCGPIEALTWVCQHWRDAALDCLQLWTRRSPPEQIAWKSST